MDTGIFISFTAAFPSTHNTVRLTKASYCIFVEYMKESTRGGASQSLGEGQSAKPS